MKIKEPVRINKQVSSCYHCGLKTKNVLTFNGLDFCCMGCKNVYELLHQNDLCKYYELNAKPGNNVETESGNFAKFNFLEEESILKPLLLFDGDVARKLTYYLPQIHCSSCLYLLENLHKIYPEIISAKLNFTQKELAITYDKTKINAKTIAILLSKLGYEPYFSLNDISSKTVNQSLVGNKRLYRLGIAGFAFSNIMLMSFPEYFDWGKNVDGLGHYFQWFSFALTLPVFFYSAQEFYSIAWGGLKKKYLTIDLPIVFALIITFGRSVYEIISQSGPGYFDSLTGIVFFMLLGRYLQDKTYENLSFSRDYSNYFPLSAHVWKKGKEAEVPIYDIQAQDEIIVHNQEIIVADGRLVEGTALIDYSFVTGETNPTQVKVGEWVYAGGRQLSSSIRVITEKPVAQGYLVSLWNQSAKEKQIFQDQEPVESDENKYIHKASQWFTIGLFTIAFFASIYWYVFDPSQIWHIVTSVLIVACPCALLLSVTFTNGHILSALARQGLFVRNASSLERWRNINLAVFDKTGTLTETSNPTIEFVGRELLDEEMEIIASVAKQSVHPMARSIAKHLDVAQIPVENIQNVIGKGIQATVLDRKVLLGNRDFVGLSENYWVARSGEIIESPYNQGTEIWVKINHAILGYFSIRSRYRDHLISMFTALKRKVQLSVISGDNESEEKLLSQLTPKHTYIKFRVKPHEKKEYIAQLQLMGKKVLMIGDGLNDMAAMKQANFSIAVTENVGYFTPGSDAILLGSSLKQLHELWQLAFRAKKIIWWSFAISILYNLVGLTFAVTGALNPLVAAVLMPASSITIVLFTYVASNWGFWQKR